MHKLLPAILLLCLFHFNSLVGAPASQFNFDNRMLSPGENMLPSGWALSMTPNMRIAPDDDVPPESGFTASLLVDWSKTIPAEQGNYFLSELIPIDPTLAYEQRVWLKTDGLTDKGMGLSVGRFFYDSQGKAIPFAKANDRYMTHNVGPADWMLFKETLTPAASSEFFGKGEIPANACFVRLLFQSYAYYGKTFKITGMEIKPALPGGTMANPADGRWIDVALLEQAAPIIDGKLDEEVWQNRKFRQGDFVRVCVPANEAKKVTNQTEFQWSENADYLYFAARCYSPEGAVIRSQQRQLNDPLLTTDEDIEIFLDAGGNRDMILQLCVNPDGSVTSWFNRAIANLSVECATQKLSDGWSVELAIPKNKLWQYYSEAGREINRRFWNFNVCRHQPGGVPQERYSAWNFSGSSFFNPQAMGLILRTSPAEILRAEIADAQQQAAQFTSQIPVITAETPVPLARIIRNLDMLVRLPAVLAADLKLAKNPIKPTVFASRLGDIRQIPGAIKEQLREYERLNFKFPSDRIDYGFVTSVAPLCADVDATILPEQTVSFLQIRAAGNEIAEQRFRLFVKEALRDLKITCTPFRNHNGEEMAALGTPDVRILQPWGKNHQADILATDLSIPFKGYLENYEKAPRFIPEIPADSTKDLMVLARVPAGTLPGIYQADITISPRGKQPTILPVKLEVLPFDLAASDKDLGFFSGAIIHNEKADDVNGPGGMFYNGLDSDESFRAHVRQVLDYGFNYLLLKDYQLGPLQPEYTDRILTLAAQEGLRKTALLGSEHIITASLLQPGKEELLKRNQKILGERIAYAVRRARELNFEVCYIFGFDEPLNDTHIEINNIIFRLAKENGANTTVACIFDAIRKKITGLDTVSMSYLGMTSGVSSLLNGRDESDGMRRHYYANFSNEYLTGVRLAFGFYLEKSDFDGNAPWSLYYLGPGWDPFVDFAEKGMLALTNAAYVFPTRGEPIPTLKFISAHAGVSDLRYIETLKKQIARNPEGVKEKAAQAQLDQLLTHFDLRNDQGVQSQNLRIAPAAYDEWRNMLQELILSLL